jgi:protein-S-isoprenylcysteine O-methyltransferase Ste14
MSNTSTPAYDPDGSVIRTTYSSMQLFLTLEHVVPAVELRAPRRHSKRRFGLVGTYGMQEPHTPRSPWWYRRRGTLIAAIYGLGYVCSYVTPQRPVFIAWGARFANGHGTAIVLWIAISATVLAWLCRASGTAYLSRAVVFAADAQQNRLTVAGPFRHIRNPLYLGNIFLALAAAPFADAWGFAIIILGNTGFVLLLAAEESRLMAERYGDVYAAFRAAVPAFVPQLRAATVPGSVSARAGWPQALLSESFCLLFGIAIVPVALNGEAGLPVFWAIWIPTLVIFMFMGWRAGRSRRPGSNTG